MLYRTSLIGLWLLVTCLSASPRTLEQQSRPADGLQLVISSAGQLKTGVPVLRVEFRNTTSEDLNLNLGIIGGWSPRPCNLDGRSIPCTLNFKLDLTDRRGNTETLKFKGIAYVAGLLEPYIVSIPAGATHVLELGLDQFYSLRPGGYDFKLGPGKYRITLEFDAPGETNRALVEKMQSWKGRVRSNTLEIERQ